MLCPIESHRKPQLTFKRILSFATRFYHYANASFQNDGKKGGSLYRRNLLQTFYCDKREFAGAFHLPHPSCLTAIHLPHHSSFIRLFTTVQGKGSRRVNYKVFVFLIYSNFEPSALPLCFHKKSVYLQSMGKVPRNEADEAAL